MTETRYDKLDQLGTMKGLPASPDEAVLERVKNPCDEPYMVRLVAPEFTSICPVTGQPDFAHLVVDYVPDAWIVESKAFKLFLGCFLSIWRSAKRRLDTRSRGSALPRAWLNRIAL